jgi:hypothetical protein
VEEWWRNGGCGGGRREEKKKQMMLMVMMSRCTVEWSRRGIVKELMEEWSFRCWRRLEGEGGEEEDDVVDNHHHVQSRVEEELWRRLPGKEEGEKEAEEDDFDG